MIKFLSKLLTILTIGSVYITYTGAKLQEVNTSTVSANTSSSVRSYHSGSSSSSSSSGWSSGK